MDTTITEVTVYPSLARVTRTGRTRLEPGTHDVVVAGLPADLDPGSVRAVASGPPGLRLSGVRVELGPAPGESRRGELQERVDALTDRRSELDDATAQAEAELEAVRQLRLRGAKELVRLLAEPDGASQVSGIEQGLLERETAAYARRRGLAGERRGLDREIAAAREAVERAGDPGPATQQVTVGLLAAAAGEVELSVSYLVAGAAWTPSYDVRVPHDGGAVSVDYTASLTQTTGEDWPELELVLSTARPGTSHTLPDPSPWYVRASLPTPRGALAMAAPAPAAYAMDAAAEPQPQRTKAVRETAQVSDSGVAKLFRSLRPLAVPGDGSTRQVALDHLDTAVQLDHVCAPRIDAEVHVRARLTNTGEATWMPGEAAVFYGDEFVGRTSLELVAPDEEVELHLGVQDGIRVERELTRRDARRAGLLGGSGRIRMGYRTTVTSHLRQPVRFTLVDQVPVARGPELEVKVEEVSPRASRTDEVGTLEWDVELEPGRAYAFTTAFTVEGPKDRPLYGL